MCGVNQRRSSRDHKEPRHLFEQKEWQPRRHRFSSNSNGTVEENKERQGFLRAKSWKM